MSSLKNQEDERVQSRRWIILIFADWVPHDMDPSGARAESHTFSAAC
jgi:hypothetical protein